MTEPHTTHAEEDHDPFGWLAEEWWHPREDNFS